MEVVFGSIPAGAERVGLMPGAFNPPTEAHLALLREASQRLDAVAFVLPRAYPHKAITGATLQQRIQMLAGLDAGFPFAVLLADQGLFIDMAREFRRDLHACRELWFICGRDAAERIVGWDYGDSAPCIADQLREYGLLVAARREIYFPPSMLSASIEILPVGDDYHELSSTMARELLQQGREHWRSIIPSSIASLVEAIYTRADGQ